MAIGAVVNALWDMKARRANKPLWLLLAEMTPDELADLIDFRYLSSSLNREQCVALFARQESTRAQRIAQLQDEGYPAYTTTPGWLGYDDAKLRRLCREALDEGFGRIKLKVGVSLEDDVRRLSIARDTVGADVAIAIDANQRWEIDEAISWITALAPFNPDWVEEPTSPDDVKDIGESARRSRRFEYPPANTWQTVSLPVSYSRPRLLLSSRSTVPGSRE